jgi:hypothetical protein
VTCLSGSQKEIIVVVVIGVMNAAASDGPTHLRSLACCCLFETSLTVRHDLSRQLTEEEFRVIDDTSGGATLVSISFKIETF